MTHWKLVTPFLRTKTQFWIHQFVAAPAHDFVAVSAHEFDVITADSAHDRSRASTSAREWLDYLRQALRARLAALRGPRPVGYITAFPPLAVCMGLVLRLTFSRAPLVAWSFNLSQRFSGPRRLAASFALAKACAVVVFSRREIKTYADMLGLPPDRFVFVPFTEEMVEPTLAEETGSPFLLAMGTANRDYRTLLAAVARLDIPTVIVAGPRALAGLDLPPKVEVRSGLSLVECHALCQRARLNVIPLDTEDTASGQVTLRYAMMFGKALVATVSIGTEDYIEPGVTGLLVLPHDPSALEAAIAELWHNPARRAAMGAAARAWLLENAGFEVGPRRLREILDKAAASA